LLRAGVKTRVWHGRTATSPQLKWTITYPGVINIDLRMLRPQNFTVKQPPSPIGPHAAIRTGDHVAVSRPDIRDGKILLTGPPKPFTAVSGCHWGCGRENQGVVLQRATVRLSAEPRGARW
jgi:hypothetical protein